MAAQYQGRTTTTAVFGGNRVVKVNQWQWLSQPSGTYFETRARQTTTKDQAQSIADGFSSTIEALVAAPDYTAVSWAQDVDPAGQLISVYTVYYYIPELEASGFVEVPSGQFNVDTVAQLVLQDNAGGTFLFAP